MRFRIFSLLLPVGLILTACSVETTVIWEIDNLYEIGGHGLTVHGDPEVVDTEIGAAVEFDGEGDMILVDNNPIGEAQAFTVEVVFKPVDSYPENAAPRFIHIQDPDDRDEKRVMIELRINEENRCYLDGFMRTDTMSLTLIDENLVHPTGRWHHAAITFENGIMTTYFNGEKELSGQLWFSDTIVNPVGKVAIGGRMDHRNWFKGFIKTLKVTHSVLAPEDFITLSEQ